MKVASIFIFFLYLDLTHLFNLIVTLFFFQILLNIFFHILILLLVMSLYVVAKSWIVNYYLISSVLTLVAFLFHVFGWRNENTELKISTVTFVQ